MRVGLEYLGMQVPCVACRAPVNVGITCSHCFVVLPILTDICTQCHAPITLPPNLQSLLPARPAVQQLQANFNPPAASLRPVHQSTPTTTDEHVTQSRHTIFVNWQGRQIEVRHTKGWFRNGLEVTIDGELFHKKSSFSAHHLAHVTFLHHDEYVDLECEVHPHFCSVSIEQNLLFEGTNKLHKKKGNKVLMVALFALFSLFGGSFFLYITERAPVETFVDLMMDKSVKCSEIGRYQKAYRYGKGLLGMLYRPLAVVAGVGEEVVKDKYRGYKSKITSELRRKHGAYVPKSWLIQVKDMSCKEFKKQPQLKQGIAESSVLLYGRALK